MRLGTAVSLREHRSPCGRLRSRSQVFPFFKKIQKSALLYVSFLIKIFMYVFISWLCWVFTAAAGVPGCASRGDSLVAVRGLLRAVPSLVSDTDSEARLGSCSAWAELPAAGEIFPHYGLNPCPLSHEMDSQPLDHQEA